MSCYQKNNITFSAAPMPFLRPSHSALPIARAKTILGFEAALFQWPRPGEEARRWDEAASRLEVVIDGALARGKGLVIVAVENFDVLLATLFRNEPDEQRLRAWLDRPKNRIMLLATATGTVDMDYDRPLFKAFEPVRLSPWLPEDCIAYFNRQREHEGRPRLTAQQEAKARAIAEFISGTPRLAQLLAEVLDTQDALTVAQTMSALADKLAEYYRRRIEDLPPLARGILDALIRGGEPASQTELAERVRARGQSDIARVMSELQRADIIRGRPAPDSRETLYSVTDRVFAHYYRLRQGSRIARLTPLATILEFLKSFYSRDEQREQALRYLEAGRLAEARVFNELASEGVEHEVSQFETDFGARLAVYLNAAPDATDVGAAEILKRLADDPAREYDRCAKAAVGTPANKSVAAVIKAQALFRMGHIEDSVKKLEQAYQEACDHPAAHVIAGLELARFRNDILKDKTGMIKVGEEIQADLADIAPLLQLDGLIFVIWMRQSIRDHEGTISAAERARAIAQDLGMAPIAADVNYHLGYSLGELGRFEELISALSEAAEALEQLGATAAAAAALRSKGYYLASQNRHEEAISEFQHAAALAAEAGNTAEEAIIYRNLAYSLEDNNEYSRAIEALARAADLARSTGASDSEARSLRSLARLQVLHSQLETGVETAHRAVELARAIGDVAGVADALRWEALGYDKLGKRIEAHAKLVDSAAASRLVNDVFTLARSLAKLLQIGSSLPDRQVVAYYDELIRLSGEKQPPEEFLDPALWLNDLLIAVARSGSFDELDDMLERHGDWLSQNVSRILLVARHGQMLAQIANDMNRASAYQMMAALLPRIDTVMSKLKSEARDKTWLRDIMSGFAVAHRDPALLRDIAELLDREFTALANGSSTLLRSLADLDEASDQQATLARMDPDLAKAIRRIRGLPDETAAPARRRSSGRRKKNE